VLHSALSRELYKTNLVHAEQVAQAAAEMLTLHNTGLKVSTLVKPEEPKTVLLEDVKRGVECPRNRDLKCPLSADENVC
jgi:hypothetical protein